MLLAPTGGWEDAPKDDPAGGTSSLPLWHLEAAIPHSGKAEPALSCAGVSMEQLLLPGPQFPVFSRHFCPSQPVQVGLASSGRDLLPGG